jgi:hypothetical protein
MTHTAPKCRIAQNAEDRDLVFRLRYSCYQGKGAIAPREDRRFSDAFDETNNHFSFLLRYGNSDPLATVRISVVKPELGWTDSPGSRVFGDHPRFQEIASESFVEANRLCFLEQARRDVFVRLLGNMAALADLFEVGWLVACPRVEHAHVYQHMFGFRPLAEPRPYFGVNFETQLLGIRRCELAEYVKDRRPMRDAWSEALHSNLELQRVRAKSA